MFMLIKRMLNPLCTKMCRVIFAPCSWHALSMCILRSLWEIERNLWSVILWQISRWREALSQSWKSWNIGYWFFPQSWIRCTKRDFEMDSNGWVASIRAAWASFFELRPWFEHSTWSKFFWSRSPQSLASGQPSLFSTLAFCSINMIGCLNWLRSSRL